jgi:hypothetical protein
MAVGIIGLCLGMLLAHVVAGSSSSGFAAFALLTLAHLFCNYKARFISYLQRVIISHSAQFSGRLQREADVHQRRADGCYGDAARERVSAVACRCAF